MDHELGEIDQRVGGDNSTDPKTAISVGAIEIADSNPKTSESTQKQAAVEDEKGKVEGEDKLPSESHVIDINRNNNLGENQRVCRICHLNAKESGKSSIELMELGCGCKGELGVAHLHCAEAWFRVKGNSFREQTTLMAKRKGRKPTKQPESNENDCHDEDAFIDQEVERQSAAIRALRDVEIEKLLTTLRLLRSYFSKDQLEVPVLQFFEENFPNVLIAEVQNDGRYEVKWKDKDMNHGDERALHASLLRRLSVAYPDFSVGVPSLGGFEFSNKSVKTTLLGADKLQIRRLVLEEPSDTQVLELKDGLQTPNVSNNKLSVGITPKTVRHPRCGEMLLSVHGSPLGVFKDDNMETIKETEDG